jgi:WD40 repeat protein
VWSPEGEKLIVSAPVTFDTLYGVSWAPDSKLVGFGCADNTVRAVDAVSGKQVLQMGTHSDWVLGTVFSQDGLHLVSSAAT